MVVTVKGLKIYFECFGLGKPLVLLHGWNSDSQIWHPLIPNLSKTFKVVTVDLPGFGQSDLPSKPWDIFDYAKLINDLVENLDLNNATFVGHSFGGRVASTVAFLNPKGLKKLILVSSAGIKQRNFKKFLFLPAAKLGKKIFSFPALKSLHGPARNFLYRLAKEEDYLKSEKLKDTFLKTINQDLTPMFKKIKVPTLIIWGENDKITPLSDGRKINQLIPKSRLKIIRNTGHFCFLEKPKEFCEIVKKF